MSRRQVRVFVVSCVLLALSLRWLATELELRRQQLDRDIVSAARRHDFQEVARLLERGANPDGRLEAGREGWVVLPYHPPVYYAVEARDGDAVCMLLDAGADVQKHDCAEEMLLEAYWDKKMLTLLLDRGIDPNSRLYGSPNTILHEIVDSTWRQGGSPEMQARAIELLRIAVERGADVNRRGMNGYTPLVFAVTWELQAIAKALLEMGADIEIQADGGDDAMARAASRRNAALVDLLVAYGGKYTIQEAVALGRIEDVRRFLQEDETALERTCFHGHSPLSLAMANGDADVVDLLLDLGADTSHVGPRGETTLHYAAQGGNPELVKLLLDAGFDPNVSDDFGETPLYNTTYRDRAAAAEVLVEAGADARSIRECLLKPSKDRFPNVLRILRRAAEKQAFTAGTSD